MGDFKAGPEDMYRATCCDLPFVLCSSIYTCLVMWKSKILMMQSNLLLIKSDALKTTYFTVHFEQAGILGKACILCLGGTCF
jgi:hypothetical protein